jgi:hypothetical protein
LELRNLELKTEHTSALDNAREGHRSLEKERADLLAHDTINRKALKTLETEINQLKQDNEQ